MKLLVEEDGSEVVEQAAGQAEVVAALLLSYVEARSAFARMRVDGRLDSTGHAETVSELDRLWATTARVPVDGDLVARAATLADRHGLRAYDAVQLAGALEVAAADDELRFACWDGDLRNAARDEGLAVLPAQP